MDLRQLALKIEGSSADSYPGLLWPLAGKWIFFGYVSSFALSCRVGGSFATLAFANFADAPAFCCSCIVFSYLLLLWEARKARAIVKSRDISYAFTNVMAHEWYALRSYDHHCFFGQIEESKKKKDSVAFWVFFTFKGEFGWRLLASPAGIGFSPVFARCAAASVADRFASRRLEGTPTLRRAPPGHQRHHALEFRQVAEMDDRL